MDDITILARVALNSLPTTVLSAIDGVMIDVVDFPDAEIEAEMGLETPFDLLGLYRGVDLTRRSVSDPPLTPDVIQLYRRPILDYWCETGEDLTDIVRHVLVHEIGHHLGFSDDDMERLENDQTDGQDM